MLVQDSKYPGKDLAVLCVVFFFQAEDGIRDIGVTGVQTCALPIFSSAWRMRTKRRCGESKQPRGPTKQRSCSARSEERRVGEEGRSRWSPDHLKKKKIIEPIPQGVSYIHHDRWAASAAFVLPHRRT